MIGASKETLESILNKLDLALVPLCCDGDNQTRLESHLRSLDNGGKNNWSRDFNIRQKQMIQFKIISQFDGELAARNFIQQNLDNYDFRRIAIEHASSAGHYENVIALCIEGESIHSQSPGYVRQLQLLRYAAYEAAGHKPEMKTLAYELLLDGDFAYFLKYKDLHTKEEWLPAFYDVLDKIEARNIRGIYVEIIKHEKHKPRLLTYCKQHQYAIASLHTYLLPEYQHEVEQMFTEYIRQQAAIANSRSQYREVCNLIKTCEGACPGATDAVRTEIKEKYFKRPAFMDELRKVGMI